ncbi:neural proliferation differentiation and control protein 1 [Talpa occidentalis]|uniref:neural proliferation differentiation and control protein 1 n=1 Tax=Talpa occidentalis TaxID=50954 RepID=UPI0023F6B186|nr:neural proliferation differentiation and control protein 1 [Talpa occidentalis]
MATPVPPPAPRHLRLLRLLLSGLVLGAALRGAAARRPDVAGCPGSLDCALKRRARCPPGAHACGPCLRPFQEDLLGQCVPRTSAPPGDSAPQPRLEDEIDFLAQELARQETGRQRLETPPQPQGVPGETPATPRPAPTAPPGPALTCFPSTATMLGLSERGQGLDWGPPPTRGTPTPQPSPSSPVSSGPVHMSPLRPRGGHGAGVMLVLIAACSVAGLAALTVAALCWCRLQREIRLARKADYAAPQAPSLPATPRTLPGDQRLAHSAEMFHYQHQRQQMLCLERHKELPRELDSASSEEDEDGGFTVYECPGLAPTGEMEVRNPLFDQASLAAPPPGHPPPLPPPPPQ